MPFLLTFLASISTILGSVLIFKKQSLNIIIGALAFASGVMCTMSIIDLIPESYNLINSNLFLKVIYILIFINIGIIISTIIDRVVRLENNLYKVGIVSMLAIIIHNIPEGIITYITSSNNIKLGIMITIAIATHNIPEGITTSLPIYYSTGSKKKALIYTFVSGISELFGAILACLFLKDINNNSLGYIFSLVAGIMLYISLFELLPTSFSYKRKKITIVSFIIGVIFMIINRIILN